jgi:hypothetical protein
MQQLIRLSLPTLLLAAGLWLLSGCLPIPTFGGRVEGRDAVDMLGGKKGVERLRVDPITRGEVLSVLGQPYAASADQKTLAYTWTIQHAVVVWPLCFHADAVMGRRTLVLRFDDAAMLRSFALLKKDDPLISLGAPSQDAPLPDDLWEELRSRWQK